MSNGLISETSLNLPTGIFEAKKFFVAKACCPGHIPFGFISPNFVFWFLRGGSKQETPAFPRPQIYHYDFSVLATDKDYFQKLGGEEAVLLLFDIYCLLFNHARSATELLVSGKNHTFFVPDQEEVIRLVSLCLSDGQWFLTAQQFGTDLCDQSVRFYSHCPYASQVP